MSLLVHLLLLKGASDWNAAWCWRILALRWHVMLAVLMLQNETKCQHYTRDITTGASIFVGGSHRYLLLNKHLMLNNCLNSKSKSFVWYDLVWINLNFGVMFYWEKYCPKYCIYIYVYYLVYFTGISSKLIFINTGTDELYVKQYFYFIFSYNHNQQNYLIENKYLLVYQSKS